METLSVSLIYMSHTQTHRQIQYFKKFQRQLSLGDWTKDYFFPTSLHLSLLSIYIFLNNVHALVANHTHKNQKLKRLTEEPWSCSRAEGWPRGRQGSGQGEGVQVGLGKGLQNLNFSSCCCSLQTFTLGHLHSLLLHVYILQDFD